MCVLKEIESCVLSFFVSSQLWNYLNILSIHPFSNFLHFSWMSLCEDRENILFMKFWVLWGLEGWGCILKGDLKFDPQVNLVLFTELCVGWKKGKNWWQRKMREIKESMDWHDRECDFITGSKESHSLE